MANSRTTDGADAAPPPASSDGTGTEFVAGGSQWHPMTAAALVGGAIAATAGAYLGTRALARRNGACNGRKVNAVMANAITACEVASPRTEAEPRVEHEPSVPREPSL